MMGYAFIHMYFDLGKSNMWLGVICNAFALNSDKNPKYRDFNFMFISLNIFFLPLPYL